MFLSFSLVFLSVPCHTQVLRNGRQNSAPVEYESQSYTQEGEFLQASRTIPREYQYEYEPGKDYTSETQYQPSYSTVSKPRVSQPKQSRIQPAVEQYLKEVTPTTKTVYQPTQLQYTSSPVAKQSQYALVERQQQTYIPQQKYEIPQVGKESPISQNILAYHNVLLAHQNAIYDKQRSADQLQKQSEGTPKSAIFISQTVPKKIATKPIKPKSSSLDEEIDYLTKLQYRQQQLQQTRIPQYSKPELLAAEEEQDEQAQIDHTRIPASLRLAKPIKLPRLQNYQPQYQQGITYQAENTYQPEQDTEVKYKNPASFQYEQPQLVQYQPQIQIQNTYRGGPKYLPEQKVVQYQEPTFEKYQQAGVPNRAAPKYQIPVSAKSTRPQIQYTLEDQPQQSEQPQQYQQVQHQSQPSSSSQKETPVYQGPTDEEYRQSEVKQRLGKNSNLRILKTGKPVVFIGHEE